MASGTDPDMEEETQQTSPKFTFDSWKPEPPAGLSFLSLVPLDQGYVAAGYLEEEAPGKTKVSVQQRRQRRQAYTAGKTVGRDIRDEKRLKQAVEQGDITLASSLIQMGVDPCCHDKKDRTPLHIASAKGDKELVKLLLDNGADPNQKDQIGNTALHLAACTSNTNVVTLLLQAGTDVNALDQTGHTPLHIATGRLRMLQDSSKYTHTELKGEVSGKVNCELSSGNTINLTFLPFILEKIDHNIIDMMKAYLSKTRGDKTLGELDDITHRLEQTSTKAEVDHLGGLLSDFASLQLSHSTMGNPPPPGLNDSLNSSCLSSNHSEAGLSPQHSLGGGADGGGGGAQFSGYRDGNHKESVTSIPNAAQYIQPR